MNNKGTPISYRESLTANDASAYWNIRLEALECEPEAFGASAEEHRTFTLEDVAVPLSSDSANNFVVGAFAGEQLVGTAGFVRNKGLKECHKGHIWGVYWTRAARGNGAGRDMLRALLDRAARVAGVEQIILAVAATQLAAMSLYRSLGFAPFGCEPRALKIGDRYIEEENMIFYVNHPHPQ